MPYSVLASRSGVSEPTLKRMLSDGLESASLRNVQAVASAMGISILFQPECTATDYCEKVAEEKAKLLVGMVQGSSALEAQAVAPDFVAEIVRKTVHDLIAGPPRRLWSS